MWRRLASIAVEDVGIADPQLVWDVVHVATAPEARDPDLLRELVTRLAAAPKDRSADYVFCGATKLETAKEDRARFGSLSVEEQLAVATAHLEPVTRRAVAALAACTATKGERLIVDREGVMKLVRQFNNVPDALVKSALALTGPSSHPFGLVLVVLWSYYQFVGGAYGYARPCLPPTSQVNGIPLYTFDKHTAVGKRAIAKLANESRPVRDALREHVPEEHRTTVAEMAAFYADAAPVSHLLEWEFGRLLAYVGFNADMMAAGCPMEGAPAVLRCVQDNLAHLDQLRRQSLIPGRHSSECN
ncbi:MAG: hypothetical protein ACR2JJ_05030 [Sphingomicrobium sp.]